MNVSTKFEINSQRNLSGEVWKPQKRDWQSDGRMSPFLLSLLQVVYYYIYQTLPYLVDFKAS